MSILHFGWNTPFAHGDTAFTAHPATANHDAADRPERFGPATRPASQARRFEHAIGMLESGEWKRAFATLVGLADDGHRPAARMALMLTTRGTSLFGGRFPASPAQRQRWQALDD